MSVDVDTRVDRLSRASLRRIIDPDIDLPGQLGSGPILPRELLSVAGLDLELTPEQHVRLAREEVASMYQVGLRFEAALMGGFALALINERDLTDPRVVYALHEIGEETRHSRMFSRLIEQLQPTARNPFLDKWLFRTLQTRGSGALFRRPALFYVMVLSGEEIPDLFQKLASEHPDTDPFLAEVSRYHRQEEARHLSFARALLPELWERAGPTDRYAVLRLAPLVIGDLFRMMVQPWVYETVGLPAWPTWRAVNRTPHRRAIRHEATRPILRAVMDAGVVAPGEVPARWQKLCAVDAGGAPAA